MSVVLIDPVVVIVMPKIHFVFVIKFCFHGEEMSATVILGSVFVEHIYSFTLIGHIL